MEEILRLIKGEVCMGTYGLVELELRKLVEGQKPSHNKQSTPLVCDVCNCLSTQTNEVHPVNICYKCYEDAH
jgi:hypothetical protein